MSLLPFPSDVHHLVLGIRGTKMSCFNSLPQELVDSIVDFLINDPESLRASSLVCHSLLYRTRTHLFRQLRIWNFQHFHKFRHMCQSSPHILPQVKTLILHGGGEDQIRDSKHIAAVISSFSRLQEIKFIFVNWALLPQDMRVALSSHAYRYIGFYLVKGVNASDFHSLISGSHDSLSSFELFHTEISGIQELRNQPEPRTLDLTLHDSGLLYKRFRKDMSFIVSLKNIHTLGTLLRNMADIRLLQNLLSGGLRPVRDFIVHMPRNIDLFDQLVSSHRLRISRLRSIALHMWDYHSDDTSDQRLLKWWIENLRQCIEIRRIIFCITLGTMKMGDLAVLKGLNELLSKGRFPALEAVVVAVHAKWTSTDVASVKRDIENQFTDVRVHVTVTRCDG
ncbi:uncharacterized protein BT62DRAFT_1006312 [Guyanagaster necrorhizus]|uniref:F-box domain-containing protein n=1 Tax=Guyanagaster necrorhizus TaxID=856835 RepID=A0A9P7VSJ5_9AGAR|nr:uncharacterized protein BT62DRAFT_1006312 [Guyanagaster necrorhizus MCA 3950]KAG7446109.1 hypothetical protein BT62DRAFT_1006312 [Guyanagaster necrorhizus MCA 3950]